MKRMLTLAGALLLALASLAGPAFAQSPLPGDEELPRQELPEPAPADPLDEVEAVSGEPAEALAVTGLELTSGGLLAVALLGAGGVALAMTRRRSDAA